MKYQTLETVREKITLCWNNLGNAAIYILHTCRTHLPLANRRLCKSLKEKNLLILFNPYFPNLSDNAIHFWKSPGLTIETSVAQHTFRNTFWDILGKKKLRMVFYNRRKNDALRNHPFGAQTKQLYVVCVGRLTIFSCQSRKNWEWDEIT